MKKQFLATFTLNNGDCINVGLWKGKSRYYQSVDDAMVDISKAINYFNRPQRIHQIGDFASLEIAPSSDPLQVVDWKIKEREVTDWTTVSSKQSNQKTSTI